MEEFPFSCLLICGTGLNKKDIFHRPVSRMKRETLLKNKAMLRLFAMLFTSVVFACAALPSTADEQTFLFDIPRSSADVSLNAIAKQANVQVLFPFDKVKSIEANDLHGEYMLLEALRLALDGTGLSADFTNSGVITVTFDPGQLKSNGEGITPMKKEQKLSLLSKAAVLIFGTLTAQGASAQDTASNQDIAVLEEIIVTAQLREQNLQDVPVSVTAFSGEDMEDFRLFSLQDIARFTPGFTGSSFNSSNPIFAVRGANNTFSQAGAGKPVGVFIDEVFIPRYSAANFDLFDLEQVAVLRGPQGTLFGRNVTGGALQITTAKPSLEKPELKLKLGGGNLDYIEAAGLGSMPLSDSAAGKASFSYKKRDGYITDRFNDLDYNDIETLSIRGQLLFEVSENLEVIASADYTKDDTNSRGYTLVSNSAGTDFSDNDGDIETAELDVPQDFDREIWGVSLRAYWDLAPGTVSSVTAYRESDATEFYSLGAGAVALPTVSTQFIKNEIDDPKMFSQELRFVSAKGEKFDYIFGFYYYNEDTDRIVDDLLLGISGFVTFVDRSFDVNVDTESYAFYADATVHLFDTVDISFGGRYTNEDKEVTVNFTDARNMASNFLVTPQADFDEFTTRVAINWHASENINLFASRTEGFTAGGFNTETNSATAITLGFNPETITAYEVGAKTQWLDDSLIFNITGFIQDFEDKQEGFFNVAERFFSIFNASEASMDGVEIEAAWYPTDGLALNFSYSYLDTEYERFVIPGGADFTGNRLQTAPENTFSAGFNFRRPLKDMGYLLLNASYSWQDDYFTGASNSPDFLIDSYGLVNASIGFETGDGRWRLSLWGNNLSDKEYVLIRGTSGAIGEYFGAPRTYGATLTFSY